jgi:hypothetical protein
MKTLEQLEADLLKHHRAKNRLTGLIEDLKAKEVIPGLKEKYEGKYFKYKNSYSCPETEKDYWYLYVHVVAVDSDLFCKANTFQMDKYGEITIRYKDRLPLSMLDVPSDKKEFDKNITKLIDKLNSYLT